MKSFLIIGLGRFGASLAVELCAQGHEVLAVDIQPERVQAVADQVTHCVVGDARDPEVLRSLGARNFDCAVAAASADVGVSALIVLNLKELGVARVVGDQHGPPQGAGENRGRSGDLPGTRDGHPAGAEPGQR